jgi:hypothetical protein
MLVKREDVRNVLSLLVVIVITTCVTNVETMRLIVDVMENVIVAE